MKNKLIDLTIKNALKLNYINIINNKYAGWVSNFGFKEKESGTILYLNLKDERDLFLLFILASAWSRSGYWEDAAYFIAYLKLCSTSKIEDWRDQNFIQKEIASREKNAKLVKEKVLTNQPPRKKIAFRKDIYNSINKLALNWNDIKGKMKQADLLSNWQIFIDFLSEIEGLGAGNKKMRIKIPLILRELRCQNIYNNIDGKYCCVADKRVRNTYKSLGKNLPASYLKASEIIYNDFGDLYDIPPFAYYDFNLAKLI